MVRRWCNIFKSRPECTFFSLVGRPECIYPKPKYLSKPEQKKFETGSEPLYKNIWIGLMGLVLWSLGITWKESESELGSEDIQN